MKGVLGWKLTSPRASVAASFLVSFVISVSKTTNVALSGPLSAGQTVK